MSKSVQSSRKNQIGERQLTRLRQPVLNFERIKVAYVLFLLRLLGASTHFFYKLVGSGFSHKSGHILTSFQVQSCLVV